MAGMGDIWLCISVLLMFKIVPVLFQKRVSIYSSIFLLYSIERHSRCFELCLWSQNLRLSLNPTAILLYKLNGFTMWSTFNNPPTCSSGTISSHLDPCMEPFYGVYGIFFQSVNILISVWIFVLQFLISSICAFPVLWFLFPYWFLVVVCKVFMVTCMHVKIYSICNISDQMISCGELCM